jgi:uncharacterized membrane protein YphA (DoxX/SURF4 family)
VALLLLRSVLGAALLLQAGFYFRGDAGTAGWVMGSTTVAAGALLLIGFLTPIAAAIGAMVMIGVGFSILPASRLTLFDARTPIVLAVTMLLAIILLGPGALSVDARMFGRREIIIPTTGRRSPQ